MFHCLNSLIPLSKYNSFCSIGDNKHHSTSLPESYDVSYNVPTWFPRSFNAALSSISPLVFLGFARIISTWGVDYQVLFLFLCTNYLHYHLLILVIHYNWYIHCCVTSLLCRHAIHAIVLFLFPQWSIFWFTMHHFLFFWALKPYVTHHICFSVILKVVRLDINLPDAVEKLLQFHIWRH